MKEITAFECEYCKRILKTKNAMKTHEPKCFKNPISKSCATCKNLTLRSCINGKPITDKEESILRFEIEGTYSIRIGNMYSYRYELNDEYEYLNNAEVDNYCLSQNIKLSKLRTNCNYHSIYQNK